METASAASDHASSNRLTNIHPPIRHATTPLAVPAAPPRKKIVMKAVLIRLCAEASRP
jgi:hypothetical protein